MVEYNANAESYNDQIEDFPKNKEDNLRTSLVAHVNTSSKWKKSFEVTRNHGGGSGPRNHTAGPEQLRSPNKDFSPIRTVSKKYTARAETAKITEQGPFPQCRDYNTSI
ncbi:hypothetical protein WMY93_006014 [Mugilogobius chulae]|uniref:Uncharacterized protein n=1 Tax=Mugilogobius chulae TaxID=88201 RepID=A0AAW0PUA1_9GOBI